MRNVEQFFPSSQLTVLFSYLLGIFVIDRIALFLHGSSHPSNDDSIVGRFS
jgi:hypothetical protein